MLPADELVLRIAFATYRNVNQGIARQFAQVGIGPEEFFALPARELAVRSGVRESFFDDARRQAAIEAACKEANFVRSNDLKAVYYTDASYPRRVAACTDAPAMLFVCGHDSPDAAHVVAIVGTRHCTAYGAEFTRRLVDDLGQRLDSLMIVSGLAYGVDIAAHRAALAAGIPTGAVLAHGLNTVYPAEHRSDARAMCRAGGFLATEYTSQSPIHRGNFLARNRIVAGMCDVLVVVESDVKGGAMTTARIAAAYDREVAAVPGRVFDAYSRGCNALIAGNEAHLLRDADDLIDLMGWKARVPEGRQAELPFVSEQQRAVLEYISAHPRADVNEMCVGLDIPFARLSALLFEMEMDDMIMSLPGGRYATIDQG